MRFSLGRVERTAESMIQDIKDHPDQHKHDFDGLQRCCFINGALDLSVMEAHNTYAPLGTNGGIRCDVTNGPCACGAWH